MQNETLMEIDYEHLDDLPLFEHIEWKHLDETELAPGHSEPLYYF